MSGEIRHAHPGAVACLPAASADPLPGNFQPVLQRPVQLEGQVRFTTSGWTHG